MQRVLKNSTAAFLGRRMYSGICWMAGWLAQRVHSYFVRTCACACVARECTYICVSVHARVWVYYNNNYDYCEKAPVQIDLVVHHGSERHAHYRHHHHRYHSDHRTLMPFTISLSPLRLSFDPLITRCRCAAFRRYLLRDPFDYYNASARAHRLLPLRFISPPPLPSPRHINAYMWIICVCARARVCMTGI